jgi:hypothetical protein
MAQYCANSSCLSCIKATDGEVNNYNQWLHINDVAKDLILTSLAPKLYLKLQSFMVASDKLDNLEVRFGE